MQRNQGAHLGDVTGVTGAAKHLVYLHQFNALVVLRYGQGQGTADKTFTLLAGHIQRVLLHDMVVNTPNTSATAVSWVLIILRKKLVLEEGQP